MKCTQKGCTVSNLTPPSGYVPLIKVVEAESGGGEVKERHLVERLICAEHADLRRKSGEVFFTMEETLAELKKRKDGLRCQVCGILLKPEDAYTLELAEISRRTERPHVKRSDLRDFAICRRDESSVRKRGLKTFSYAKTLALIGRIEEEDRRRFEARQARRQARLDAFVSGAPMPSAGEVAEKSADGEAAKETSPEFGNKPRLVFVSDKAVVNE